MLHRGLGGFGKTWGRLLTAPRGRRCPPTLLVYGYLGPVARTNCFRWPRLSTFDRAKVGFVNRWSGVQISHPAPTNQKLCWFSATDLFRRIAARPGARASIPVIRSLRTRTTPRDFFSP